MKKEMKCVVTVNMRATNLERISALEKTRKEDAKPRDLTAEETAEQLKLAKKKGTTFANQWAYRKRRDSIKPHTRSAIVDELIELGLTALASAAK